MIHLLSPLDYEQHKDLCFHEEEAPSPAFAPISLAEAKEVAKHAPVVFRERDKALIALLGLDNNLMMKEPLPRILSLYPFAAIELGGKSMIAIDEGALQFKGPGEPLFRANGEQSELLQQKVQEVIAYAKDMAATRAASALLGEFFIPHELVVNKDDGEQSTLIKGFCVLDMQEVKRLPDSVIADFYRRGYLDALKACELSLALLDTLGERILASCKA